MYKITCQYSLLVTSKVTVLKWGIAFQGIFVNVWSHLGESECGGRMVSGG